MCRRSMTNLHDVGAKLMTETKLMNPGVLGSESRCYVVMCIGRTSVQRVGLPPSRVTPSVGLLRSHDFGVNEFFFFE